MVVAEYAGPCPFCGDTDAGAWVEGSVDDEKDYYVWCPSCLMRGPLEDSETNAILNWNYMSRGMCEWKKVEDGGVVFDDGF